MNKAELIDAMAKTSNITKKDANEVLYVLFEAIADALSRGAEITLQGFGTFSVKTRAARTGRNPQTGEAMDIPASQYVSFKPGKALKDAVN